MPLVAPETQAKPDILRHQPGVHANRCNREGIGRELNLDINYDLLHRPSMRSLQHVTEEQARRVDIHPLVAGNELIAECPAGHRATLLKPEDRSERSAEEDTFNHSERDETRDTTNSPIDLHGQGVHAWTSPLNRSTRFSLTMPSDAAKNAKM